MTTFNIYRRESDDINPPVVIATGLTSMSYSDDTAEVGKTYLYSVGAEKNGMEKISSDLTFYAFNASLFKIKSNFSTDFSDGVGGFWSAYGNAKIQDGKLILDGSGDYLSKTNNADFNLNHSDDLTIRFIVNPLGINASSSNLQALLSKRPVTGSSTGFELTYDHGFVYMATWSASSTSVFSSLLSVPLDIGQENEISFERKAMVWYAYKNGDLISTANQTGVFGSNTSNLTLGRSNATNFQPSRDFNGLLKLFQFIRGIAVGNGQNTTHRI